MNTNGEWFKFSSEQEIEEYYTKEKFRCDFPDYPKEFTPGWYYVYTEGRYFRIGVTDHYMCFIKAEDRIKQVQEAIKEMAEELRIAKNYKNES